MAESGPQKASEPDPDASRHSETAEEENPAIAAFNSWGGEGSPPPPGFAHAPPAANKPARRRTIGRIAGGLAARRVLFSASASCLLDFPIFPSPR